MRNRLLSVTCFITLTCTCFAQRTFKTENGQVETFDTSVSAQTVQMNNSGKKRPAELSEVLADMEANNFTLFKYYKSGVKMVEYGRPLAIFGGCTFILGMSGMLFSDDNYESTMFLYGYISMTVGICTLGAGIPIWVVGNGKKNRAIRNFSKQYYSSQSLLPYFQINMYPNRIGLVYVF